MDFNKLINSIKQKIDSLSDREKIAYGAIILGAILIIIALLMW